MKKKLLTITLCIGMILSMGIGLTGCGDTGEKKAEMVIGTGQFVDTLNPITSWAMVSFEVFQLIYDPLVRNDDELKPIPCLAESWEVSDDNLTWTFTLAEANWHDGEPLTSEDVKFTYELLLTDVGAASFYGSYLTGIEEITCPDERTVVITTSEPKANMLQNTTPILPKHIWAELSEDEIETFGNDNPIGTGPYKFGEMNDNSLTLLRNDDYFGTPGNVEAYSFVEYKNSDSTAQALKTGEIDAAMSLDVAQMDQLSKEEGIDVISGEVLGFTQLCINVSEDGTGNPILKDKAVRHAIDYCIDKQKGLDMAYLGAGTIGTTLINPSDKYHWEPTEDVLRSYNIDKANEILDEAGYVDTDADGIREDKNGNPLEFELISIADNAEEVKYGQIIKAGCKEAGIEVNCVTMDSGALSDQIYAYDYDMFIWGWGSDVDPGVILNVLTTDYGNEPGWSNARYDELYLEQAVTLDEAERISMVQEMQQIAYEEAPYIVFVYNNTIQAIRSDKWEGYKMIPENGSYFFNLSIENYMNMKLK